MTEPHKRTGAAADARPAPAPQPVRTGPAPGGQRQHVLDLMSAPSPTLDNFVAGDNAELVARLRETPPAGSAERFIYLWGAPGSGRTHLLRAALAAVAGPEPVAGGYLDLAAPDAPLGVELLADAQGRARPRVALDNVDALDAGGQQRLFNLCNTVRLERPDCMLLVAGPLPPVALPLRADLVTRLGWGLTYEVRALTDAQKAAAMAGHARLRGVALGGEVLDWLLQTMPRDLPTLLAAIDALDRYSLAARRTITLPLAREWLKSLG